MHLKSVPPAAGAWAATDVDASSLIRQRRSVQRMDGHTRMAGEAFERALARTLPADGCAPFDALPVAPALNLVLFVHAVEGLAPGLYALIRNAERLESFRDACQAQGFEWAPVADTPLPLFRLQAPADVRRTAAELSCHQGIAAGGAFSLAMLADIGRVLGATGPWVYRHLHWEAGMVGQALYLESEAAGLRGTGIGCFFDDGVHRPRHGRRRTLAGPVSFHRRRPLGRPASGHGARLCSPARSISCMMELADERFPPPA